jgi:glycosyltransferase involved in cell wall biosynthesis
VVAEALAHGLPVISTATGGIPDLVADDAGLLVPSGDAAALAAAIARVLVDPLVQARLARGARRARERLASWEVQSGQMAEVLGRVAADGRFQR